MCRASFRFCRPSYPAAIIVIGALVPFAAAAPILLVPGPEGPQTSALDDAQRPAVMAQPFEVLPEDKAAFDRTAPAGPSGAYELLPTGYRRVTRETRVPLTEAQRAELERLGKAAQIDPATGERIVQMITDYLPEHWGAGLPDVGFPVDSFGRPIINTAAGLPGWAQADVDALRDAIAHWVAVRAGQADAGQDLTETDGVLGNFIGQAIVRDIAFDDLVSLNDPASISETTARSIINYLHFYENLKFIHADDYGYSYAPTTYSDGIVAFVAAHGGSMEEVLRIEPPEDGGVAGSGSGCYTRTTFARGMTNLVGQTNIWVTNGFDDESADISTGFPVFFFYECQDPDNNSQVRVSTNGYISFFQQGGGATDGVDFSNDAIPSTIDPDGYAAPWWDDLIVATSQGNTDRVSYKTEGATTQRVFTVEWFSMTRLGGASDDWHYFQVKLYETTGVVELHISNDWNADSADNATIGLENYDGTAGDCGPNCLNTNATPPPNNYRFAPAPRPDNNNCSNAFLLRYTDSRVGINLRNATADGESSCGSSNGNRDVWYTFVAGCAGTLNVNTCGTRDANGPDTGPDTVLSVHTACPGTAANQIACNDDASVSGCDVLDSAVNVNLTAGQRVYIRVTHFDYLAFRVGNGLVNLNVNFTPDNPPSNDNCANATTVANRSTTGGALLCASADGSATCGASTGNPDIWYRFTAPPPGGQIVFDTCGSLNTGGPNQGPDTVLSIHTGCPGSSGNQIACNDDSGGGGGGCAVLDSRITMNLAACQTVRIRVSHFGFSSGNGLTTLRVNANYCIRGDSNCDGLVNNFDIDCFVRALTGGQAAWNAACLQGGNCGFVCANDIDGNGLVNNFDIEPFVQFLANGGCP